MLEGCKQGVHVHFKQLYLFLGLGFIYFLLQANVGQQVLKDESKTGEILPFVTH